MPATAPNTDTSARPESAPTPSVSVRQMVAELQTYPRWVSEKRMTQALADKRTGILVAVIAKLQPEADAERDAEAAAKEAEQPRLL